MARTNLREVLEAIASKNPGLTQEKDAVALLDLHLGLVQGCQHTDALARLIQVRDGARKALQSTFQVRTESMLARSHAEPLEQALAPLERLIERMQTEDKPEKERFEKRWKAQGWRVEKLLDHMGKSTGGWPSDEIETAVESFRGNARRLMDARDEQDFAAANKALDQVEKDLRAYDEANAPFNEEYKQEYLELMTKVQKVMDGLDPAIAGQKLGSPPVGEFAKAIDIYEKQVRQRDTAVQQNDYRLALLAAKNIDKQVKKFLDLGLQELKTALTASIARAEKMRDGMAGGAFPGVDDKPLKAALSKASDGLKKATTYDCAEALASQEPLEAAIKAARTAAVRGLVKAGDKAPKAARAKVMAMLKHDPSAMNALAEEPGGKELLDAMVNDLGGKAKDADSKAFVRSAITARFGPKLDDKDLTTKYLPRLYKVLGMVPGSHTLDNPQLALINRKRTKLETSGDYSGGTINLKAPRTGIADAMVSFGAWVLPQKLIGKQLPGGVSQFDQLTLHEVGHAVDDKKKFMDGKTGSVSFGGWQKHSVEDVAHFIGEARGFFADFADLGKPFLKAYLAAVLQKKKKIEDEAAVKAALPGGAKPDWRKLAKHAAVDHAENIRMKSGSKGLWDRGDSAAAKYAIGDTVFQESYAGKWVSYALSARSAKVTDYQFRADGEWYAEAYAAFFLGKLKTSHPLHPILTKDKQSTEAAQRAAR